LRADMSRHQRRRNVRHAQAQTAYALCIDARGLRIQLFVNGVGDSEQLVPA
jgi:hypothetical protein